MKRRIFLAGSSALPFVGGVQAQSGRAAHIGFLRWGTPGDDAQAGFGAALGALGYREGQNIVIEWRWATSKDVAARHVAEFVAMGLDLVAASATPAAHALRDAKVSMPIVLAGVADPVASGLVASLARPGGNITGVSNNLPAVAGKRVQLLSETLPKARRIAFLGSKDDPATSLFVAETRSAARTLNLSMQVVAISQPQEFEAALGSMLRERADAVIVQPLFTLGHSRPLADILLRLHLPSISDLRPFAVAGGLMTYGPSRAETWRRAASFVDRVLKGAKPADLPIEEPSSFELVVNLKTAAALGVKIPQSVLLRADEVIE